MSIKTIAISGSGGVIGQVISRGLSEHKYNIVPIDLPEVDVLDFNKYVSMLSGVDVLIDLAWQYADPLSPEFLRSLDMTVNAIKASLNAGVKRLIVASSVHSGDGTPYGQLKALAESMARSFAMNNNIEIVVVRFGGVSKDDLIKKEEKDFEDVWLRHCDCVDIIRECVEDSVEGKFKIINATTKERQNKKA